MAKELWEDDGSRYVASLQDVSDPCCYKDFYESNKCEETKQKAEKAAEKHQRSTIVFDRKLHEIIHRQIINKKAEEKPVVVKSRCGRKKVEKKSTESKYFDD